MTSSNDSSSSQSLSVWLYTLCVVVRHPRRLYFMACKRANDCWLKAKGIRVIAHLSWHLDETRTASWRRKVFIPFFSASQDISITLVAGKVATVHAVIFYLRFSPPRFPKWNVVTVSCVSSTVSVVYFLSNLAWSRVMFISTKHSRWEFGSMCVPSNFSFCYYFAWRPGKH